MARTRKPPPPLESEVQRSGIALLEHMGWTVCVRKVGAVKIGDRFIRFEKAGRSDLYGMVPGPDYRHFEAETKRPGKKPTREQMAWLRAHNNKHSVAFWYDNVDTLKRIALWVMAGGSTEFNVYDCDFDLIAF
jgi:hypothetical protein